MAKLEEMIKNEEFVKKMAQIDSDVEVAKLFKANNVEISAEEFEKFMDELNDYMENSVDGKEFTENELDKVAGGAILETIIFYAVGSALVAIGGTHTYKRIKNEASCIFKEKSAYPDNKFYTCK